MKTTTIIAMVLLFMSPALFITDHHMEKIFDNKSECEDYMYSCQPILSETTNLDESDITHNYPYTFENNVRCTLSFSRTFDCYQLEELILSHGKCAAVYSFKRSSLSTSEFYASFVMRTRAAFFCLAYI